MKTKLLFICAGGLDRSPTAAYIINTYKEFNKIFEAKSCGIQPLISAPITKQNLQWADQIFVMEPDHKRFLLENFPLIVKDKPEITILDIPNEYVRTDPELEKILMGRLRRWLEEEDE